MTPRILKVYEQSETHRDSTPSFCGCKATESCKATEKEKEQIDIEEFQLMTQAQGWKFGVIRDNGIFIDEKNRMAVLNESATKILKSIIDGQKINLEEKSIKEFVSEIKDRIGISLLELDVKNLYDDAAREPQADLCCPQEYLHEDTAHIPPEALANRYGCGSPLGIAVPRAGEVAVDLGSGSGVDCFVAAKKVGPTGRIIGIDFSDEMLKISRQYGKKVAENLGYDIVEFHRGKIYGIPLPNEIADIVVSNCVINLCDDIIQVFKEVYRVLKIGGRFAISDIVSERETVNGLKEDTELRAKCFGYNTLENYMNSIETAGFKGVTIKKLSYWKKEKENDFYSVTLKGYK